MSVTVIKIEELSKVYRLGEIGTGTLSHDLNRWMAKMQGKQDPFAKVDGSDTRLGKEFIYALQDINYEIKQGDVLGIIGRNGAGKSTLLKIISKITLPTTGRIKIKGRIASLLEVGTGFHPELTGRENIFLNGAILGMSKREIRSKFDSIVDFAGVEPFIDTPVKRYSSGMYVRLAFSVAAFLEPEILVVDEVLAVGDVEFQKKCLGRMKDVSTNDGRTVLFVSHNLAAIQTLCNKAIYLEEGKIKSSGAVAKVINDYAATTEVTTEIKVGGNKSIWISRFSVRNDKKENVNAGTFQPATFTINVEAKRRYDNVYIGVGINDRFGSRLFTLFSKFYNKKYTVSEGNNEFVCEVDRLLLKPGIYSAVIYVGDGETVYDYYDQPLYFEVAPSDELVPGSIPDESQGNFIIDQLWK